MAPCFLVQAKEPTTKRKIEFLSISTTPVIWLSACGQFRVSLKPKFARKSLNCKHRNRSNAWTRYIFQLFFQFQSTQLNKNFSSIDGETHGNLISLLQSAKKTQWYNAQYFVIFLLNNNIHLSSTSAPPPR